MKAGANPNRLFDEEGGISAFHIAVGIGNVEFTKAFLSNNADVNLKCNDDLGWTPLHVCAYWNKYDSLKLLLAHQAADPFKLSNVI